jgi:hypothetical protein
VLVPPRSFIRYAAYLTVVALGPGMYYPSPQLTGDNFGQECSCNTVMYRCAADRHVWSDDALIVQLDYGVYWMSEWHHSAMADLETELSIPIHQYISRNNPSHYCRPTLGLPGLYRAYPIL